MLIHNTIMPTGSSKMKMRYTELGLYLNSLCQFRMTQWSLFLNFEIYQWSSTIFTKNYIGFILQYLVRVLETLMSTLYYFFGKCFFEKRSNQTYYKQRKCKGIILAFMESGTRDMLLRLWSNIALFIISVTSFFYYTLRQCISHYS